MQNGETPKTSQASPQTIKNVFLQYAETGDPALYIAFSSGLSGTYQTAVMIANEVKEEFPDFDLRVIDSKCASLDTAWLSGMLPISVSTGIQYKKLKRL